jgi:hypothetical protein
LKNELWIVIGKTDEVNQLPFVRGEKDKGRGTVRNRWLAIGSVVAALGALGVAGYGCGGSGPISPTLSLEESFSTALTGRLTILMTDAPIDDLSEVHVYITGVSTQVNGGTVLSMNENFGDVDLLALQKKTMTVVNTEIPSATYDYVGFNLDQDKSYVIEGGERKPLSIPNGSVKVTGPFVVTQGATTTVTLDFDAKKSLTHHSDGSWSMNPVVVVASISS